MEEGVLHYTQVVKVLEHIFSFLSSGREHTSLVLAKSLGDQLQSCKHLDPVKWELKYHSSHNCLDLFNWIKTNIKPKDYLVKDEILDWLNEKMKIKEKEKVELENYETTVAFSILYSLEKELSASGHSSSSSNLQKSPKYSSSTQQKNDSHRQHPEAMIRHEPGHLSKGHNSQKLDDHSSSHVPNRADKGIQIHGHSSGNSDKVVQTGQLHKHSSGHHVNRSLSECRTDFEHHLFKCISSGPLGPLSGSVEDALNYHLQKENLKKVLSQYLHDHRPTFNMHAVCPEAEHNWRAYVTMHLENPFMIYAVARKFHVVVHVISLAKSHVEEIRMYPKGHVHGHSEKHIFIGHCGGKTYMPLFPFGEKETPIHLTAQVEFKECLRRIEELERENMELRIRISTIEIDSDKDGEKEVNLEDEKKQMVVEQNILKQKHSDNNRKIDKLRGGLHREKHLHMSK